MYLLGAEVDEKLVGSGHYPFGLAAVKALPDIDFAPVTVLAGDNGTGKSTLIEALAIAAGFNPEGGSRNLMFETLATHSDLAEALILHYRKRPKWGWFLRAETFYGMATHIAEDKWLRPTFPDLHNRSHGESFLTLIDEKLTSDGLYFLDEPESALSFHGQLKLLITIGQATKAGAQFVIATHSPILMSFPGAKVFELDEDGVDEVGFDDLQAVQLWRNFLDHPDRFFHHLLDDDAP